MIVFVALATVLALPLVGLFFFRLYENQLIRQTEAELVAQSAVLAAVLRARGRARADRAAAGPDESAAAGAERYTPIVPGARSRRQRDPRAASGRRRAGRARPTLP